MIHTDIATMAMRLERARRLRPDLLERERRVNEALSTGRPAPAGAPGFTRHTDGGWQALRRWLGLPWGTAAPGVSAPTRIALVALAALLTLPAIPTDSPVTAKAKAKPRTVTRTFRDPFGLELLTTTTTSPVSASANYPAQIIVDGLKTPIRDLNVRLTGFAHARPDDIEMLLVGPQGQTAIVLADVGGTTDTPDVTLRLDDEAASSLPDESTIQSGSFRPTNALGAAIAFNAPAPSASASAALSIFDGTDPNGTWRLFAQDDHAPTGVGYVRSWALDITARAKVKPGKRNR